MITVTAYNPAKSPMTFTSAGKSKKVSPHVSAVKAPVAYKNKSAIQSVKTFFKALPIALGLGAMTPAFQSCDPVDVGPITPPATELSPMQKEFATTFNTMYGTSSAEQAKAGAPSKVKAANTSTALPKEFVVDYSVSRTMENYSYDNPDTAKVAVKVIDIPSDKVMETRIDKIYMDENNQMVRKTSTGTIAKYTVDPSDLKIVESNNLSSNKYKYIPKSDSTVIKKTLKTDGVERVLKIMKRVNL